MSTENYRREATLETDTSSGGPRWSIDGAVLGQVAPDHSLEYDTLELTVRATPPEGVGWGSQGWGASPWGGEVGAEFWRQFDRAGDFTLEPEYGGSWTAIPTGDDDNLLIELEPPESLRPPFAVSRWIVDDVDTTRASPEEVIVTASLVRIGPREDAFPDDVTNTDPHPDTFTGWSHGGWGDGPWSGQGAYSWTIELAHGTIELRDQFVGRPTRSSTPSGEEVALPLALDHAQAAALADSVGRLDGLSEHSVPRGRDIVVDETTNSNQTIELEVPVDVPEVDDLESGTYFVRDWGLEALGSRRSERPWRAELALTRRTD